MNIIQTDKAPKAIGPYSQGMSYNGLVYTSGQIPLDPETMEISGADIKAQTRQVMLNLQQVLEAAGSSLDQVIKTTCFLSDMNNFVAFNEVYAEFFGAHAPARSCVEVARLPKDVLVEVEAVGIVK